MRYIVVVVVDGSIRHVVIETVILDNTVQQQIIIINYSTKHHLYEIYSGVVSLMICILICTLMIRFQFRFRFFLY